MSARSQFSLTSRTCQTKEEKGLFKARVHEWAVRLRVKPAQVRVQRMKSKWASCSPGKWVSFSEDILVQNSGFQTYVIVHELLHLRVPNHGRLFKSLMSFYMPDWERWEGGGELPGLARRPDN
ncbi:MAG: M48 family metallopeptidase [Victivallales bacterium]|nr:M48 family metallopeptidase [Victivallales bacterium]